MHTLKRDDIGRHTANNAAGTRSGSVAPSRAEHQNLAVGRQLEPSSRSRDHSLASSKPARPATADSPATSGASPKPPLGQEPHAPGRRFVVNCHERIAADIQNAPRQDRNFAARKTRHDGVERPLGGRRLAGDGAAIEAIGFVRLDNNISAAGRRRTSPRDTSRCPAANPPTPPCTNTWVGNDGACASASFDHQAVTLHHVARNVGVALVRCIGNDVSSRCVTASASARRTASSNVPGTRRTSAP